MKTHKLILFSFLILIISSSIYAESCPLSGDQSPCGTVSLNEIVSLINEWAQGNAVLSDVIQLINAWAAPPQKPVVELFVMSYCPYGLQIEKGLIPVLDALNGSANFSVRFCSYAMHGKKEIDEDLLQYCIQKEDADDYLSYLRCFLAAGNSSGCLNRTKINASALAGCINSTDSEYSVSSDYVNESTWINGMFPPFDVEKDLNDKYGVYGSPTFVLNGTVVGTVRDPKSLLATICAAYSARPAACSANLSNETPSAGFGFIDTGNNQSGSC
jgi:hypothetical protein